MAKHLPPDNPQPNDPNPSTPRPAPAKPVIPNMSLDEPEDVVEAVPASEVVEAEIVEIVEEGPHVLHVAETTSQHDIAVPPPEETSGIFEAEVISEDDDHLIEVVEEIEEVPADEVSKPESDVILADADVEAPLARTEATADDGAESASAVLAVDENALDAGPAAPAQAMDSPVPQQNVPIAPDSDVLIVSGAAPDANLNDVPTEMEVGVMPPVQGPPTDEFTAAPVEVAAETGEAEVIEVATEADATAPVSDVAAEAWFDETTEATPGSAVIAEAVAMSDVVVSAPADDALLAPGSAVILAESTTEAPTSDVAAEALLEAAADATSGSAVVLSEPADDFVSGSAVVVAESAGDAPASAFVVSEAMDEAAPVSDVVADAPLQEAADIEPASAVVVAESDDVHIEEAVPASAAILSEPVEASASGVAVDAPVDDGASTAEPASVFAFSETPAAAEATVPTSGVVLSETMDTDLTSEIAAGGEAVISETPAEELHVEAASAVVLGESAGNAPISDLAADALLEDAITEAVVSETPPASDVAWEALVEETSPASAVISEDTTVGPPSDLAAEALLDDVAVAPGSSVVLSESPSDILVEEALPASEIVVAESAASAVVADELLEEAVAEISESVLPDEDAEALLPEVGSAIISEAPASDLAAEALFEEVSEISEAPASGVVFDDEASIAAASNLLSGAEADQAADDIADAIDDLVDEDIIEEVVEAADDEVIEDLEEAMPASAVADDLFLTEEEIEEAVEAAGEAAPVSAVAEDALLAEEEIEEAVEASAVEEAIEDDLVLAEEDAEEVLEAEEDLVLAEEEPEEVSAVEDDLLVAEDEVFEEASPASEVVEEALEAEDAEEVSSATRKSESVFDEELIPSSAADVADSEVAIEAEQTESIDAPPGKKSAARKGSPNSGTVFFDEPAAPARPASGATADFDRTLAFDGSGAKKSDQPDSLVTEEELSDSSEGSAVNLGELPPRKGGSSTTSGIDRVAEALESGIESGDPQDSGSVEFDELLDDSAEQDILPGRRKKKVEDGSTEMDAEPLPPIRGKKDKKDSIAQTGDDVDLDELFADEAEPAEAVEEDADAEALEAAEEAFEEAEDIAEAADADDISFDEEIAEADEAEPAEALDDEALSFDADEPAEAEDAEALDADDLDAEAAALYDDAVEPAEALDDEDMDLLDLEEDEKPARQTKVGAKAKAGKKTSWDEDEEEVAQDLDDEEEEDTSAKKKKSKKDKATPAPARPGRALPMMAGMFVGGLLLAGGLAAGLYFFPDEVRNAADQVKEGTRKAPVVVPKATELTRAQKARDLIDKGNYAQAAKDLEGPTEEPIELSTRAEAQWLAYYKQQADQKLPLERKAPAVEGALKDLEKAKNNPILAAQITEAIDLREKLDALQAKTTKELAELKLQRDAADKFIDSVGKVLADAGLARKDPDAKDTKVPYDATLVKKVVDDYGDKKTMLAMTEKALKETEEQKKVAESKVEAVDKVLEGEKTKDRGDKGVLEIIAGRDALRKDRDGLSATLKAAFQELVEGKIVPDGDATKEIVKGAKIARQKAESPLSIPLAQLGMSLGSVGTGSSKVVEDAFKQVELLTKLSYYKGLAELGDSPEQKMDTHIVLLQDRRKNDKVELDLVRNQTDWLLGNTKHLETRGKARYVQALIDRNRENFNDARTAIDDALKFVRPLEKTGAWTKLAEQTKRELTDPYVYFLPRMHKFLDEGNAKAALDEANLALKALPDEGRLFAQRAQIQFEMVRGQGAKMAEEAQKAIRADADQAAAKNDKLTAEASYLKGLLEEELGRLSEAEKRYREAIDLHRAGKGLPEDAAKHRLALGRLLLRDRTEAAPVVLPPAQPNDDKKGEKAAAKVGHLTIHPWTTLVLSATVGQIVEKTEKEKEEEARFEEARKFAEELIEAGKAAKDKKVQGQGHILLGHAYSKLGRRTQGLKEFARGIELLMPANLKIDEPSLSTLIEEHPAFQQPDLSHIQNDVIAQRHFGEGLHLYWSKNFAEAEHQFLQAVKWYNQDARYQYFLGLAQFNQKSRLKRDAAFVAWEQGARIEAKQPTRVGEINRSLERVQGELRQVLNNHRYKGIAAITER